MTKLKIFAFALGLGLLTAGLITITSSPAPAAGSASVNIPLNGTVNVRNPLDASGEPIPLVTLDAFQPYEDQCGSGFGGGNAGFCSFHAIPAGKRLVIQEVDATVSVETGLSPTNIEVIPNGPGEIPHEFTATFMGTDVGGNPSRFSMHQETRLYAGQNTTPLCLVRLTGNSNIGAFGLQLSGFLVDVR